jgi:hypothetical protein
MRWLLLLAGMELKVKEQEVREGHVVIWAR